MPGTGHAFLERADQHNFYYDDETNCANHYRFYPVAGSCGYRREFLYARVLAASRRQMRKKNATAYEYMYAEYPFLRPWVDSLQTVWGVVRHRDRRSAGRPAARPYAAAPVPTDRTAVIVHGYTDCAVRMLMIGYLYNHDLGYNILLPDLYYHGQSEGRAIRMGWLDRLICCAGWRLPTGFSAAIRGWSCMASRWGLPRR